MDGDFALSNAAEAKKGLRMILFRLRDNLVNLHFQYAAARPQGMAARFEMNRIPTVRRPSVIGSRCYCGYLSVVGNERKVFW